MPSMNWRVALSFAVAWSLAGCGGSSSGTDTPAPAVPAGPPATSSTSTLADLFVFRSPSQVDHTVLIMTLNSFAGAPGGGMTTFDPTTDYDFQIDTTGDTTPDLVFRVQFGAPDAGGTQQITLREVADPAVTVDGFGSTGQDVVVSEPGGSTGLLRAGLHDDPSFFDEIAFHDLVGDGVPGNAPASDVFGRSPGHNMYGPVDADQNGVPDTPGQGPNVLAIALELPSSILGLNGATLRIWATLGAGGVQFDRAAVPFFDALLVASVPRTDPGNNFPQLPTGDTNSRVDEFGATLPRDDDALFAPDAQNLIDEFYRSAVIWPAPPDPNNPAVISTAALVDALLPNTLPFQLGNANGYADGNGRRLHDDVIDVLYTNLTDGQATTDFTFNDSVLSNAFPYLGAANAVPQARNLN